MNNSTNLRTNNDEVDPQSFNWGLFLFIIFLLVTAFFVYRRQKNANVKTDNNPVNNPYTESSLN